MMNFPKLSKIDKLLSGGTCAGRRKACRKTSATHTEAETQAAYPAQISRVAKTEAGSFWLVIYEHQPSVIKISQDGRGFFAVGQQECWSLPEVNAWLRHIPVPPPKE